MFFDRVSFKDKMIFTKNLAIMLNSGLTITEALEILGSQAGSAFKIVIADILKIVTAGNPLSQAFGKYPKVFSSFYIHSIAAAEASGNLEANLKNIYEQMEKEDSLNKKIKSALIYPALIIAVSVIIGIIISFVVLPKIMPIFTGLKIDLPVSTRILIWLAGFMKLYGAAAIGVSAFLIFFVSWLARRHFARPLTHFIILHSPVLGGLSVSKNMASFCRSMNLLLKSGLSIDECLQITSETLSNYYYKKNILIIRQSVRQGVKLSDSIEHLKKYFPPMAAGMIRVGEKSGNLEAQFLNLSNIYQGDVDNLAKTFSIIIEPILLIIIGLAVGGLALSIITPIYKITGNIYR